VQENKQLNDRAFFLIDYAKDGSDVKIGRLSEWNDFHKDGEVP